MKVPSHIAIIMDGNGRWASDRGLPRRKGHLAGINAFEDILKKAVEIGVAYLTVYAFSTENWKRPGSEVNFLIGLFQQTLINKAGDLFKNNIRVKIIGRRDGLSSTLLKTINKVEEETKDNRGIMLNIAFNYGGRAEIIDSISRIMELQKNGEIDGDILDEKLIEKNLYNNECPEVELLIRTGGEKRMSNFLLWQSAYAELYFTDKYWPDFDGGELEKAVNVFRKRNRRFGGLTEVEEE